MALIVGLAGMALAQGEIVHGRSRELGIEFRIIGDTEWCSPNVRVYLKATRASVFKPEGKPFLRALGRIRAIIDYQCPTAEHIVFEGEANRRPVFAAEMSRLTAWRRLIKLDPQTKRPLCGPAAEDPLGCEKRVAAYETAKRILRGDAFAKTQLTTLLDPHAAEHLVWTSGPVVGQIRVLHFDELGGQFKTNAALADASVAEIGYQCSEVGGQTGHVFSLDFAGGIARRTIDCTAHQGPTARNIIIVTSEGKRFLVFSLLGEGVHAEAASTVAAQLIKGIQSRSNDRPSPVLVVPIPRPRPDEPSHPDRMGPQRPWIEDPPAKQHGGGFLMPRRSGRG